MKTLVVLLFCFSSVALAVPEDKTKRSREVNFEDLLVKGKYHFSDEAVTTVEQDKILNSLISVRKDFKDRIKKTKPGRK